MAAPRRSYTIEEANALVPQVRAILLQLAVEQHRMEKAHAGMHRHLAGNGDPSSSQEASRLEQEAADIGEGMRHLAGMLAEMGIQLRDAEMGLVDFPGERDGKAVWLCWQLADPEVAFWHGTDEGYATRKPW
jgi:hypothetical protein